MSILHRFCALIWKQIQDLIEGSIEKQYDRHIFSSQTHEKLSVSCIEEIFFKYIEKGKRNIRNISEKRAIHHILWDIQQLHIG